MANTPYEIKDKDGNSFEVFVYPDRRLKKSARWVRKDEKTIVVRVPYRMPRQNMDTLLDDVRKQLAKMRKPARRRTDADLQERATAINNQYFGGRIKWNSIRWVGNMRNRLGSCTNGGSTDGHIRISDRIYEWPQWVVDYVIAHELAHRVHSDHSPEFWEFLESAYPNTHKAIGFIDGVSFATHENFGPSEPVPNG